MNRAELINKIQGSEKINGYEAASAILPHAKGTISTRKGTVIFCAPPDPFGTSVMVEVDSIANAVFLTLRLNDPPDGLSNRIIKTRDIYHTRKGKAAFMRLLQEITSCP